MKYYVNGHQVSATQAREFVLGAYMSQGGDADEFNAVWGGVDCEFSGDEKRELLNEWSGYVLEIYTEEQEEEME